MTAILILAGLMGFCLGNIFQILIREHKDFFNKKTNNEKTYE